jgi:hypothetical protein
MTAVTVLFQFHSFAYLWRYFKGYISDIISFVNLVIAVKSCCVFRGRLGDPDILSWDLTFLHLTSFAHAQCSVGRFQTGVIRVARLQVADAICATAIGPIYSKIIGVFAS